MKCLCMTVEHTTINLTPAELTGQKPMQPLLGTEHYQCMDSLFIRGSIRHCSLHCHTGYETDRQQVNAVSHTTLPAVEQQNSGIMHGLLLCSVQQCYNNTEFHNPYMLFAILEVCTLLRKKRDGSTVRNHSTMRILKCKKAQFSNKTDRLAVFI